MANELITLDTYDIAAVREANNAWQQNLGHLGITPTFPKLKIPAGGGTAFEDPRSADPESPESLKEFTGVIVGSRKTTKLYLTAFEQRDADDSGRPDAWSIDGTTQIIPASTIEKLNTLNEQRAANGIAKLPTPSRSLANCPYSQFGSAALLGGRGKGKATNDYFELYVFDGKGFPVLIAAPAGSISKVIQHLQNLVQSTGALVGAETVVGLRKEKSGQGIEYSQLVFSIGKKLDPAAVSEMRSFESELRPVLQKDPFNDAPVVEPSYDYDADLVQDEAEMADPQTGEDAGVAAIKTTFAEPVGAGVGDIEL